MKKVWLVPAILFMASALYAASVWKSSTTASADTTKRLCTGNKAILHGVCVNDGPSGLVTVYDSSATATSPIAVIRSSSAVTAGCLFYDVQTSSGLTYTTSAAGNVTFLYGCY